ncbi:MAG: TonB-dependent receptor [Muribaculaceae bacterium]|nr:TonB-dependent receptor [Muribaculaceae bacterium]
MWALLCSTASFAYSHDIYTTDSISEDSIDYSISPLFLNEVVVTASPIINKTDGKIIRPNKEILLTSSDGIDLLRKLHLSRITVNPLTNSIDVVGGGEVILCINGVESTQAQIMAIQPQDIMRIEYHDNPGIRYSAAAVVIDYITVRQASGGNILLNTFDAFGKGKWASIDNFAAQYNQGRSVWTANAGYFGKRTDNWSRDYDETWKYPDAIISRHECGLPVTVSNHFLESSLNYNYMHPSGNILNVRLDFNITDVPNKEEGDRRAVLKVSNIDEPILVTEHTAEHSVQPNIGLYYQHKLSDRQSVILDAQGSYIRSRMLHEYSENEIGESSRVNGDRYAVKFLGLYENRLGSQQWSIAVSGNSSIYRNTYMYDDFVNVDINQSEAALMGEYSNRFGNWGIMGNLKAAYRHLGQQEKTLDKLLFQPEVTISYRPVDKSLIRYSASMNHKMPSTAEISYVEQPIQPGMVRRGNPELRPFRVIDQSLDASFESRLVGVDTRIEYRNEHNPIMESVIFDNGEFVRTYFNQRSFQRLTIGGSVSLRPWNDHLSITASPMLTRYFSHGIDYSHCHNIFRVGLSIDFSYGNWLAYGNIMSGPANYMYGEEIIEEKDMNQIMVGYKRDKWSIHAGVFDAFINYWMESRNMSALTPYRSKAYSGRNSSYIAVRFSLMLDFGRKRHDVNIPQNNIDSDSGILTGAK